MIASYQTFVRLYAAPKLISFISNWVAPLTDALRPHILLPRELRLRVLVTTFIIVILTRAPPFLIVSPTPRGGPKPMYCLLDTVGPGAPPGINDFPAGIQYSGDMQQVWGCGLTRVCSPRILLRSMRTFASGGRRSRLFCDAGDLRR